MSFFEKFCPENFRQKKLRKEKLIFEPDPTKIKKVAQDAS